MALDVQRDASGREYVFDSEKQKGMRNNFEHDREGELLKDANGHLIPRASEVYPLYIALSDNTALRNFLNVVVQEIVSQLPDGTPYYAAPPETYHISVFMAQDLRPDEAHGAEKSDSVLTDHEKSQLIQMLAENLQKTLSYSMQLVGIRFVPHDGSVIAIFEDKGQTDTIRGNLTKKST